ncbi:unnamed protein product [Cylicocyclus nassatus]|uniref:BTB domain-containing protein n=1 Tax=Cylicocyclus nassatus TaxID=53992 RepID=A0AA36DRY4_CYLNA|nr:unnamed protein product [Cylicocyclus nassatus]
MTEKRKKLSGESHHGVKINVGGTIFQTSFLTLTRLDNTMLSAMVANHWRNQDELFIDRYPTHFAKVLDYLRDGENFALPLEEDVREALRKEAEFYNIPGLAKMCSKVIKVGDMVQWQESVIEEYWKYLVRYLHTYPFTESKMCMACACSTKAYVGPSSQNLPEIAFDSSTSWSGSKSIKLEKWTLLKHHMRTMKGTVIQVSEQCCHVKYSPALVHLPKSALRLSR